MRCPDSAQALGATLYVPAIRSGILDIVLGRRFPGLRSVVLCLEDSLADGDVDSGLQNLRSVLAELAVHDRDESSAPLVFVRPRNLAMARRIADQPDIGQVHGFVAPKCRNGRVALWRKAVEGTDLLLMPTLETREFFDAMAVREFAAELGSEGGGRIFALRVGGNDLMACLGLRRMRGTTLYEGPLAPVLAMLVGTLAPAGFSLTSPVFEILDDPETLAAELRKDMLFGFVGKTAIHPSQVATIQNALKVSRRDHEAAIRILDRSAPAVFRHDGAMCEVSTHSAWAARTLERAKYHGFDATFGPSELAGVA